MLLGSPLRKNSFCTLKNTKEYWPANAYPQHSWSNALTKNWNYINLLQHDNVEGGKQKQKEEKNDYAKCSSKMKTTRYIVKWSWICYLRIWCSSPLQMMVTYDYWEATQQYTKQVHVSMRWWKISRHLWIGSSCPQILHFMTTKFKWRPCCWDLGFLIISSLSSHSMVCYFQYFVLPQYIISLSSSLTHLIQGGEFNKL